MLGGGGSEGEARVRPTQRRGEQKVVSMTPMYAVGTTSACRLVFTLIMLHSCQYSAQSTFTNLGKARLLTELNIHTIPPEAVLALRRHSTAKL